LDYPNIAFSKTDCTADDKYDLCEKTYENNGGTIPDDDDHNYTLAYFSRDNIHNLEVVQNFPLRIDKKIPSILNWNQPENGDIRCMR